LIPIGLPTVLSGWDDCWPFVPLGALLAALLWTRPLPRTLLTVLTLGASLSWGLVVFTPVARLMTRNLVRKDPLVAGDAIFVFSSRVQKGGELTTVAQARLIHGLALLKEGFAPRLVLSELKGSDASYLAAARRLMTELGLPGEVIAIGPVGNTHDEAVSLAALARAKGWRRILGVTSPLHTRRASLALEAQGLEVVSSPAPETGFDLETLDRGTDRLEAFRAALHERIGLLAYSTRGWLPKR
jgi:uncharacterized SAM-binding protein YcdF (DUF218 family)